MSHLKKLREQKRLSQPALHMPAIQAFFMKAKTGWKRAPLAFEGGVVNVTDGTISWNNSTNEWKAQFPTPFGVTDLGGTFDDNGILTLVDDSTGGYATADMPAIQEVFLSTREGKTVSGKTGQTAMQTPPEQLEKLKALPGNGEEYGFQSIQPIENSPLAQKKLCILGSSVVYGSASLEEAVGEYLAARFDLELTKEAVSGTTLVDNGESSYIQRMLANLTPDAPFDLFLCQLSTNDASRGYPLGEISSSTNPSDFDTATITGAIEYIISYVKDTWGCPVLFFTGTQFDNAGYQAMVMRLIELKGKWDIGVLDLWTGPDFNKISEEAEALYMSDSIHPTKAGYREWWGPELEKQLLEYLFQ